MVQFSTEKIFTGYEYMCKFVTVTV